ncbi:IPT/TIG domain-containing protein [Pontibacter akesuensis]|uniref:IPT/TIG domain-containing protein n=1 Tax=Pontibacter akesuensis TaxID=388950 RepID=A0A1I7KXK5_9BACT|nr:IPT/TIG domain-containing protein [Pontibacter akesuensis]SFV02145.1 IPT/TIG domain-containing protein [Pontibacter akesuensis]
MLKIFTKSNLLLLVFLLTFGAFLTSCDKDDDVSINETQLHSYGPSPALRGGELKFIGINLDKVTAVILPDNIEVTTFKTKTPTLLVIEVPEATVEGNVSLRTPNGMITAKSWLGISEPITVASVSPATVRPGDVITIKGTYLNLVEEVIFANNKVVTEFESHTKDAIQVRVPMDAQTGAIMVSNGADEPILVSSEAELQVALPAATSVAPNPVKAGSTLTITGTNLDLAKEVIFGGNKKVTEFTVSEAGDKLMVTVPADAADGKIKMVAASLVEVESAQEVTMVVPTISGVTPRPAKNSGNITIRGTNLDLVTSVMFGGETTGTIVSKSGGELVVKVPADAVEGIVTLHTAANKTVATGEALTLVKPVISSVSPTAVKTLQNVTISGTNLDIIEKVMFTGDTEGTIVSSSATELVVTVPTRSQSGAVTLISTNGTRVVSSQSLSIQPGNVPSITSVPPSIKPGQLLVIEGMKLDLTTEVIFPGNIKATQFGAKTATRLEVVVPEKTAIGVGRIRFVTAEGDVTESPEINFVGSITYYIYNDAINAAWQQWGGWNLNSQDWASTEQVKSGTKSIKVDAKADGYGAIQAHPSSTFNPRQYEVLVISLYSVSGGSVSVSIKDEAGTTHPDYAISLPAGQWKTVEIPISALGNPSTINEFIVKNYQGPAQVFYVDEIGFR